jgi:hypothetical protein
VRFTVQRPAAAPLVVEADAHAVEGAHHVFRRDVVVVGRARTVVALRVRVDEVVAVLADDA